MSQFERLAAYAALICLISGGAFADSDGQETCGLTQKDGVNTFTIHSSSPYASSRIPLIHIQYDTKRELPITSTVVYDKLNLEQNFDRKDVETPDSFRQVTCEPLSDKQQDCNTNMRLSTPQKDKIKAEYNSWDRGHLTPVNPMRFAADAINDTFYCVNIAPQEPWSNRCPWLAVEERTLSRTKSFPSYVITGTCNADNDVDGKSWYNQTVPECFWKMQCYLDPATQKTTVVAFIGDNTLIDAETKQQDRKERFQSYVQPHPQETIRELMGSNAKFINRAWTAAEKVLLEGREISGELPKATACQRARGITEPVMQDWNVWMSQHKPTGVCRV